MARNLPDVKKLMQEERDKRTPDTLLGKWHATLSEEESAWFWDLMKDAYFDGEYGAIGAVSLARPHLPGMPTVSDNAARKFLNEQRPSEQKRTAGRGKRKGS